VCDSLGYFRSLYLGAQPRVEPRSGGCSALGRQHGNRSQCGLIGGARLTAPSGRPEDVAAAGQPLLLPWSAFENTIQTRERGIVTLGPKLEVDRGKLQADHGTERSRPFIQAAERGVHRSGTGRQLRLRTFEIVIRIRAQRDSVRVVFDGGRDVPKLEPHPGPRRQADSVIRMVTEEPIERRPRALAISGIDRRLISVSSGKCQF